MIQELLGGGGGVGGAEERKVSINGGGVGEGSSTSSSSENLRCPRCDSSNTKFCYYNNYNLTQPRHFCKTCRRYWTKGGALRNVPIGGGCRKNKSSTISATTAKSGIKSKPVAPEKTNLGGRFDQDLSPNPICWPSPPTSQLFALLRAAQNPNPSSILNSLPIKEDMGLEVSQISSEPAMVTTGLSARALNLDYPLSQVPQVPLGLCSSFWRSNLHQQPLQQHPLQHNLVATESSNTGIQELYHRLRSSANYHNENSSAAFHIAASSAASSPSSFLMEPAPLTTPELGFWTTTTPFPWSDLSTTNGAFP